MALASGRLMVITIASLGLLISGLPYGASHVSENTHSSGEVLVTGTNAAFFNVPNFRTDIVVAGFGDPATLFSDWTILDGTDHSNRFCDSCSDERWHTVVNVSVGGDSDEVSYDVSNADESIEFDGTLGFERGLGIQSFVVRVNLTSERQVLLGGTWTDTGESIELSAGSPGSLTVISDQV